LGLNLPFSRCEYKIQHPASAWQVQHPQADLQSDSSASGPKLARETGVDKKARAFSPWSHIVTLIYSQLAHCLSLNDVCDGLSLHGGHLSALRGATPPSRNGEIVVFDKAYVDFSHLADLSARGVFWVTRAKDNMKFRVERKIQFGPHGAILRDDLIRLKNKKSRKDYPEVMRRIVARVEVDGRMLEMVFLTNNLIWSASSVADLYRSRWSIEVFFKQLKQTLQLGDFLGHNANAVKLQVWIALLVYVLLRYLHVVHAWAHSFSRLFTVLRSSLWRYWDLTSLLRCYGTAGGHLRMLGAPEQAVLPGYCPPGCGTAAATR
jgi:hypothetical protein